MSLKFVSVSGFAALLPSAPVVSERPRLQPEPEPKRKPQKVKQPPPAKFKRIPASAPPPKPVPSPQPLLQRSGPPPEIEVTPAQIAKVRRILDLPMLDTTTADSGPKRDALAFENDRFALRYRGRKSRSAS